MIPKSRLYEEGLAGYFERYCDDSSPSGLGRLRIGLLDVAASALQDFNVRHHGSVRLLAGAREIPMTFTEYAGGWGLVGFLQEKHPTEFSHWASRLDSLVDPAGEAFAEVFGNDHDAILSD